MSKGMAQGRRGRRPGRSETRAALIDAAREVFVEQGYDGATMRAIGTRAGVDAAMVQHWFGSKEGLFAEAVINVPFDLDELVEQLLDGDADDLGRRMVRTFLTNCDAVGGGVFVALLRSVTGHEQAGHGLHDFMIKHIVVRVLRSVDVDQPEFRATLVAAQLAGLGVVRYVTRYEPLASAEVDTIVAAVAPTVQRYITGAIA